MSNNTIDTLAFVSNNAGINNINKLYQIITEVLENDEDKRVTLKDVIIKIGYKIENIFRGQTYLHSAEIKNNILYVYTGSRAMPSIVDIEIIARYFDLEYHIKSSCMVNGTPLNTDEKGEVFPRYIALDYVGRLNAIEDYYEDKSEAIMIAYSGLTFETKDELSKYFRNRFGRVIPEAVLNDENRLEIYLSALKWEKMVFHEEIYFSYKQIRYLENFFKKQIVESLF